MKDEISHLPGQILFDIARNDSAIPEYRNAAVEILVEKKYPQADNPELAAIVAIVKERLKAKADVTDIVETAIEQPLPDISPSVFKASVTTETLNGEKENTDEVPTEAPAPKKSAKRTH